MRVNPKVIFSVVKKYAPSILSGMAVAGVGLTGWLSYRAARKSDPEKTFKEQWKIYIPAGIAGAGTIACIVGSNWIHLNREASLIGAVSFYKAMVKEYEDYEDEMLERFGDAGLKVNNERMPEDPKTISRNLKIRIWEPYTKQWFESSQQEILWAELTANKMLQQKGEVTLNDVLKLYSDKNIKIKKAGDTLGWSYDDEVFTEGSSYYYAGAWIDMCPQFVEVNGEWRFQMEYGMNPNDLSYIDRS